MNIIGTAILLGVTLLVVPVFTFFFGTPLGDVENKALDALIIIVLAVWVVTFVLGEITDNVSQVDKIWSIMPMIYAWVVAWYGDFSPRLMVMALLVTAWGVRLTYNFSRHGAYQWKFWKGHEDYRWEVVRQKPEFQARWKWTLFNALFITGYQNVLIMLFTMPILVALQFDDQPLGVLDWVCTLLMLFFIVFETVADNQQRRYQDAKRAWLAEGGQGEHPEWGKGFLDKGLWAWSRHPNYFAEQAIWISFYGFSVAASGQWLNWSIAGCLLLVILFRGSSNLSEEISASKYPQYADYQARVPRFIPRP